jgi:hypothetical protein
LITRLKSEEQGDTDGENFVWKNLNTLQECLKKSWAASCGKDVFDLVPVDL